MLIIIFIITSIYLCLIGSLVYGFDKVLDFKTIDISAKTKFSIVIPFRNEAAHLEALLTSISELNYPRSHFEIIMVDDDSSDNSVALIHSFNHDFDGLKISVFKNNRQSNSPKKDAITMAIHHAKYDWIVTTDADCLVPKYWLDIFDQYIQGHQPNLIIAPVALTKAHTFLERFQILDILSLQGATIGGFGIKKPFLCNGANLAYRKDFFNTLNGFSGNLNIASGDDIFLLEKAVKQDKNTVHYLKNNQVIVSTPAQSNFKSLKAQRVRWAAKTSTYHNGFGKAAGFTVLIMNALLVCLPLVFLVGIITLKTFLYTYLIKILIDFLLLFKTARFFNQEQYLPSYLFSSVLYPFFSVYIGFISVFKGYKWKGRTYTK
ncbi:Glycosyltransferase, catalytic subunit of cellulose synthase and poly-beta-1,6-N-acetylglucosamine synthase [Formosa sp. Hel1_31_208]|uniref:glycosyltransferase n=1 Tax=Formosa sp. Hel1_31_208 TaxID=1798225 RepID=UPI00087B671B|nr:glycosyltransferase [Formosa sp. Hel1_31_208]SDR85726.1 Glycosyltransferase, catalytic subunit of cellulose synthase and poly-beta-1,6-N-acetylglucosamine synthase [Formosa sp. Hel1_31_208]